ncbi:ATP-binding protein [Aquipuribacter nitratireducens]|uniref:ATP-binding protein n=1 Tax=Aquipuribacter nitratireducens TaxID=650104 RepID=A0ABW0GN91_9MICO
MASVTAVRTEREWALPHAPAAVPRAREELVGLLTDSGVPEETVVEAELAASELLGNAIVHGRPTPSGSVLLRARVRDRAVEVAVTDGGPAAGGSPDIRPRNTSVVATRGRGLRIVRSLAHEWGVLVDAEEGCTTVWAALGGPSRRRAL